jgi:hypothetical protein
MERHQAQPLQVKYALPLATRDLKKRGQAEEERPSFYAAEVKHKAPIPTNSKA